MLESSQVCEARGIAIPCLDAARSMIMKRDRGSAEQCVRRMKPLLRCASAGGRGGKFRSTPDIELRQDGIRHPCKPRDKPVRHQEVKTVHRGEDGEWQV